MYEGHDLPTRSINVRDVSLIIVKIDDETRDVYGGPQGKIQFTVHRIWHRIGGWGWSTRLDGSWKAVHTIREAIERELKETVFA